MSAPADKGKGKAVELAAAKGKEREVERDASVRPAQTGARPQAPTELDPSASLRALAAPANIKRSLKKARPY